MIRTVANLLDWSTRRLQAADLHYGHGTDNPRDEAAALVFHALGLDHSQAPQIYAAPVDKPGIARAQALVQERIERRVPSAYLTGVTWFAGLEMRVTADVLVPRSPIAELCLAGFEPWVDRRKVSRVLDIGTGSGCIAIAAAKALPKAQVDAVDVSAAALKVCAGNIRRHRLSRRVHPILSDVYQALGDQRYDIIVSNPPYVSEREMAGLPAEYRAEPALGLRAGRRGLDIVRRILQGAPEHLNPGGILVVEVGDTEPEVSKEWPKLPLTWLQFEQGGGGVFILTAEELGR